MKQRIVSFVPAATEIVCALGHGAQLVGRSQQCDFPPEIQSLPICCSTRVNAEASSAAIHEQVSAASSSAGAGGLYAIDTARLAALRPDLVLTQGQCGVCAPGAAEVAQALGTLNLPLPPRLVTLEATRLAGLWDDIRNVADAIGVSQDGRELLSALKNRVVDILQKSCVLQRRPVACLEWLDPPIAAGHWMPDLVDFAGGLHLFGAAGQPSPALEWRDLTARDPEVIILFPCGFSLDRTRHEAAALAQRPEWRKLRAVKAGRVFAADGSQYFNRPGPRLVESLEILTEILWPKLFSFGHQNKAWAKL